MSDTITEQTPSAVMPHNHETEKAMLGAIMYDSQIFDEAMKFGITDKHFYSNKHRAIFLAIKVLCEKRNGFADMVTVAEYINNSEHKELFEDAQAFCETLLNPIYSTYGWRSYAKSLCRLHKRRRIIRLSDRAKQKALEIEEKDDVETLVSEISEGFFKEELMIQNSLSNEEALNLKMQEWQDAIDGNKVYYPCYLRDVDTLLGGFVKGKVYFVGAPPADGKTTFMINQAEVWGRDGIKSAIASLEMEHTELMGILAAKIAETSAFALRTAYGGQYPASSRLNGVKSRVYPDLDKDSNIMKNIIIDDKQMNIDELCSWIRYMKHKHNVEVVMIDYLQIIQPARGFKGTTREMTNDFLHKLKYVAKETGVSIVCLSQLTKDGRKGERRPSKNDLKESGMIEEIAYGIILLYYFEDVYYADIAKNRGGLTGIVTLIFEKSKQFITDGIAKENKDGEKIEGGLQGSDYHDASDRD